MLKVEHAVRKVKRNGTLVVGETRDSKTKYTILMHLSALHQMLMLRPYFHWLSFSIIIVWRCRRCVYSAELNYFICH
jgi:hypothetical protein